MNAIEINTGPMQTIEIAVGGSTNAAVIASKKALESANSAEISFERKEESVASALVSTTKAGEAATSAEEALDRKNKAEQWADADPTVPVEPGKFSAKHWATQAQESATVSLKYRGGWSAAAGTFPDSPELGDYYKITEAGLSLAVNDSIIYNGVDWDKIDNTVNKADVGLENVDNTADLDKPISTATQEAITAHTGNTDNPHGTTAVQVGAIPVAEKGAASGVVPLSADSKIAAIYLPSYVDDVLEYANVEALPEVGEGGKMYVALDTSRVYRWSGSAYIEIAASPGSTDVVTEGVSNLYFTVARVRAAILTGLSTATNAAITAADTVLSALGKLQKQITDHFSNVSNPHGTTALQVLPAVTDSAGYVLVVNATATDVEWSESGGGNDFMFINSATITKDVAITSGNNAMSAGPITIADGKTVTIPDGSVWSIV